MNLVAGLSAFHYRDEIPKVISLQRRKFSWVQRYTPVISALGRLGKEGLCEVEASLGYTVRVCFKKKKEGEEEKEGRRNRVVYGRNNSPPGQNTKLGKKGARPTKPFSYLELLLGPACWSFHHFPLARIRNLPKTFKVQTSAISNPHPSLLGNKSLCN